MCPLQYNHSSINLKDRSLNRLGFCYIFQTNSSFHGYHLKQYAFLDTHPFRRFVFLWTYILYSIESINDSSYCNYNYYPLWRTISPCIRQSVTMCRKRLQKHDRTRATQSTPIVSAPLHTVYYYFLIYSSLSVKLIFA